MEALEFVRYAKSYAGDDSVKMLLRELESPRLVPNTSRSAQLEQRQRIKKKQAEWFASLGQEGQENLRQLLIDCSELTLFNILCLIDGVGGNYPGVFEITAVNGINRTLINPQNTEMLHDLLSDLCNAQRNS